jgi:hypothetical protein
VGDLSRRSIHLDHSGVEIRARFDLAGVVADAAHGDYVDEADQKGDEAPETNDFT